ncbi:hypothetical protein [Streptomyces physcomitrii]|uniref:Uncharacterized protein n=1 Tax=Streptomyces physcomitrii TaxID=2724184 RepID=A0ABX1GYH5_9ACTN|nr:hypothetical protein [Streptomyces physcomitrii]NKI40185.1 hypothetical protein [Streptomyces physcomitrii]
MTRWDRLNPMSHPNRPPRTPAELAVAEVEAVEVEAVETREGGWSLPARGAVQDLTPPGTGTPERTQEETDPR